MSRTTSGLLCLLLLLLVSAAHAAPADLTLPAQVALRATVSLTESQLSSTAQVLRVIAASEAAGAGDWDKLAPLLAEVPKSVSALAWFVRPDGTYRAVGSETTGLSLKDRPYFSKLMAGETAFGELVVSKATNRKIAVIAVPVLRDSHVVGAVGASIYLDDLSRHLESILDLPRGWGVWAVDASGTTTTIHFLPERIFQNPGEAGSPSLRQAVQTMVQKKHGILTYTFTDGKNRAVVYRQSDLLKWLFVLDRATP